MTQNTYEQGYKQALEDIKILVEAVNRLEDFGSSVGGSSSFWEDVTIQTTGAKFMML